MNWFVQVIRISLEKFKAGDLQRVVWVSQTGLDAVDCVLDLGMSLRSSMVAVAALFDTGSQGASISQINCRLAGRDWCLSAGGMVMHHELFRGF